MTTLIIVSILAFFAAAGVLNCRLQGSEDCVRPASTTYRLQRLSDRVVLVSRIPRRTNALLPTIDRQLDASLRWTPNPCGFPICSRFYQAL
jgi:hypothetical protein